MSTDQIINLTATVIAVAAVVYAYVSKKSAADVVTTLTGAMREVTTLQSSMQAQLSALREPLEAAMKRLPKTRSRKVKDAAGA